MTIWQGAASLSGEGILAPQIDLLNQVTLGGRGGIAAAMDAPNCLVQSSDFIYPPWQQSGLFGIFGYLSPIPFTTGANVVESTGSGNHYIQETTPISRPAGTYTFSIYYTDPNAQRRRLVASLTQVGGAGGGSAIFAPDGTVASYGAFLDFTAISASVQAVGGGWYRGSFTFSTITSAKFLIQLYLDNGSLTDPAAEITYTGNNYALQIACAQLEQNASASVYKNITNIARALLGGTSSLAINATVKVGNIITQTLSGSGSIGSPRAGLVSKVAIWQLSGTGSLGPPPAYRTQIILDKNYWSGVGTLGVDAGDISKRITPDAISGVGLIRADAILMPFSYPPQDRLGRTTAIFDRYIRRSGRDYAQAFFRLFPRGMAWPRDPDSMMTTIIQALTQIWGSPGVNTDADAVGTQLVDGRAGDLLQRESDPRQTIELLPDWERNFGLPDPCYPEATSIGERQKMLVTQMTFQGGQSRLFFTEVAAWVGHGLQGISEYSPFMCGISECGDTRDPTNPTGNFRWEIGPPEMRFYWTAHAGQPRLTWFRCGSSECGVDSHLEIGIEADLECLLRRWRPAHTELVYDFSSLFNGGPLAGTP